ncbi:putative virulence factor [Gallibacterium sp. AGMB14963]|uniref:putative virulence factor n=1 Tax=Gallibacterium faecale TaxID=3019086 RepID=UPI0022F1AD58|nr:putative virulence factor [Gallibacterium sp. AGMB14963]MDA3979313.1 putative virulence factor [Gallibacterium sp. AGMB14963]
MNNMTQQLAQSWQDVFNSSQSAIDWVEDVRPSVTRLNNEADSLILELRRLKNMAKRLGNVSTKPITAGFFGLSQAGKSFLISALAADEHGKLETNFDGQRLDFIKHINPPGGGKEATGLVTRFTRKPVKSIAGYPLELRLFSEIEIAKILVNAYFNDFDKERVEYEITQSRVNSLIKSLSSRVSGHPIAGVNKDDVVDLQDYALDSFGKSLSVLQGNYWANATALAPYLTITERGQLFSILWGEISELTAIYVQFANLLAKLGHPDSVYAPLNAIVKTTAYGKLSQADSIMNVDMLERLGTDRDETIHVRPAFNENIGDSVEISLAELTALTAELVFPLINPTRVPAAENLDLLDFPGYRGRLGITSLSDINEGNPVSQLILRGKVAYLFERYTDSQEMNILIVCTPSTKQSDVNSVGPVLERWINKTQGDSPEQRSLRKPGLLWAITMFDMRISQDLSKEEELLKISWGAGGLLKQTILERFGNYDWFNNWANDKPFNNVFLVRKPGFKVAFLNVENDIEVSINENERNQLNLLRQTFCQDPDIQKHIANPEDAWDAMLLLNDGGMKRISNYLETIALPEVKQRRLIEQLNERIHHVVENRFANWYHSEGEEEVAKKRQLANAVAKMLLPQSPRAVMMGELLHHLQLPEETIRSLYFSDLDDLAENDSEQTTHNPVVDDFDLFSDPMPTTVTQPKVSEKIENSRFAQAVFKAWVSHLRNLTSDHKLMQYFGLATENIENIVNELVTGANRLNLQEKLSKIALHNENSGSKRDQLAERQVFTMSTAISDFIAWLGYADIPLEQRPSSRAVPDTVIFEQRSIEQHNGLPKLNDQTSNYSDGYRLDWLVAFGHFAVNNAGHSAGREISPEQNAQLGTVLNGFRSASITE